MTSKTFLFVNKDTASECLTRNSGNQLSAIRSHAQRGRRRPRKSKKLLANNNATSLDDRALYDTTIRNLSCKFDPFSTASIRVDGTVRGLIEYYVYFYHPMSWTYSPVSSERRGPYAFGDSVTRIVKTALSDTLQMYCLLSAAVARVYHIDGLPFPTAIAKEHHFMQQSLALLQERILDTIRLGSHPSDQLLSCIMFLACAEGYRSNYTAAKTHLKASSKLLEPSGGVLKLQDKNLQGQLLMSDLTIACANLQPCIFGCDYDPGPASVLKLKKTELSMDCSHALGTSLLAKSSKILPPELRELVLEILESYNIRCRLNTAAMTPTRAFETTHWVAKRNMAIRSRLLSFIPTEQTVNALRIVLVMWTILTMTVGGGVKKTIKIMASNLLDVMERTEPIDWIGHEDVKLWILLVAWNCAREDSETYAWFAERIRRMRCVVKTFAKSQNHDLIEALALFQCGFLYDDLTQKGRTEKLAGLLTWWDDFITS